MSALTTEKVNSFRKINRDYRPLAAVKAIKGGMVACKASGYYGPATGASGEINVGARFRQTLDNTGGSNGSQQAEVEFFRERTVVLQVNDSGTPLTVADRENPCYQLDDQTVTGDSSKAFAGLVYDVTSEGVWVDYGAPSSVGPTGPQGATGATGPTGPQGPTGP